MKHFTSGMKIKLGIAMVLFGMAGVLVACGSEADPNKEKPGSTTVDTEYGRVVENEITLENGSKVTCLIFTDSRKGGMSCNWRGANK